MEMRGQDEEMGMPNSLAYNQHNNNRESPSKLSSLLSSAGERRNQSTVAPSQPLEHHHHVYPSNLQRQAQAHRRDQEACQDPGSSTATNTVATSTHIASGSQLRSPTQLRQTSTGAAAAVPSVRYRECLRNHAATMGTHVLDGCGEFMPSGEEGTPEALKCAACDCHRNFHRKEIEGESQYLANCYYTQNPSRSNSRRDTMAALQLPPAIQPHNSLQQHHRNSHGVSTSPPAMMMAFGGGSGGAPAESSSEDLNMYQSSGGMPTSGQAPLAKKRFRTKFTQEQKDKMMEFCEKLGWKIQKQDGQEVQRLCSEIGVRRQVFKVWMHNNKQAMKKKQL